MPYIRSATKAAAERRLRVVELRDQRVHFTEIGRMLGISGARASRIYHEALALIPAAAIEQHRAESLRLIEDQQRTLIGIIERTEHSHPHRATEASRVINMWEERKSRLLGMDAPARSVTTITTLIDADDSELDAAIAELERRVAEAHRNRIPAAIETPSPPSPPSPPAPPAIVSTLAELAVDDDDDEPEQPYRQPERGRPHMPGGMYQREAPAEDWSSAYREQPQQPEPEPQPEQQQQPHERDETTEVLPGWRSHRTTSWG